MSTFSNESTKVGVPDPDVLWTVFEPHKSCIIDIVRGHGTCVDSANKFVRIELVQDDVKRTDFDCRMQSAMVRSSSQQRASEKSASRTIVGINATRNQIMKNVPITTEIKRCYDAAHVLCIRSITNQASNVTIAVGKNS